MATQLERPSRLERSTLPGTAGKIQRLSQANDLKKKILSKPISLEFILMILVAVGIDLVSFVLSSFGLGFISSALGLFIFTLWFHLSGLAPINLTNITSAGATALLEFFPFTGAFPCITANVIFTYYS